MLIDMCYLKKHWWYEVIKTVKYWTMIAVEFIN